MTAADPAGPTYVVVDIEADGPYPEENSMLSLGAVAVSGALEPAGEFSVNLAPRPGMRANERTLAWFRAEAAEAFERVTRDPVDPAEAMAGFAAFVESLPGPRVFVAHPVIFDGPWVDLYLGLYTPFRLFDHATHARPLFARTGLDLPSLVMGVTGRPFVDSHRERLPADWFEGEEHTHDALDDARGYARVLVRMLGAQRAAA